MASTDELLNAAVQLQNAGRTAEAEAALWQAIAQEPGHADANHLLGLILHHTGRSSDAVALIRQATAAAPGEAVYFHNLGEALLASGAADEARQAYARAAELAPHLPQPRYAMGLIAARAGDAAGAAGHFAQAVRLAPDYAEAWFELGLARRALGEAEAAAACWERVAALRPDAAGAILNLGTVRLQQGRFGEAAALLRRALQQQPDAVAARLNLAKLLGDQGNLAEAAETYREAARRAPDDPVPHSNLLFLLNHDPSVTPDALLAEHRAWAARFTAGLPRFEHARPAAPADAERVLRVGYVSPDFRDNQLGFFIEPILAGHHRRRVWAKCYSDAVTPDAVTARLRRLADAWEDTRRLTNAQLAERVRADRIDLLVDLTVHGGDHRLVAFARRPAPVQLTYLGYPNTTGLDAIDYRVTDVHLDPPGMTERFHSEELLRLPDTYFCYTPPAGAPEVGPPPSRAAGHVTFGSFNRLNKLSDPAVALWARVLCAVPNARLFLKAPGLGDEETRRYTLARFAAHGIDAARIEMEGFGSFAGYLSAYARVDVALDPFPFNGGTTSLHGMWMGVPLVTLAGRTAVGRMGVSILTNVGLTNLIAADHDQFVAIASSLAQDARRLAALRDGMRARMSASPLTDRVRFVAALETAYREVWRRWCGHPGRTT